MMSQADERALVSCQSEAWVSDPGDGRRPGLISY